jgi:hypothetical protein
MLQQRLTTEPVIATDKDEFQGVYSPDGKKDSLPGRTEYY